jgi:16S rRNA (guanine527-N7)-methyltransferase
MVIMAAEFPSQLVRREAAALGVDVAPFLDGLDRYAVLLERWNARINLTAIRDPHESARKHFVDSLAVVPWIPAGASSLVDVGSGPGFPGAVLGLARPALTVTLVESNHKKCAFLEALRREIPIPNLTVNSVRAESLPDRQWDVAVSRATLDLPDWLALGRRLVRSGGTVLAMEGADQHALPPGATRHPYDLAGATRSIVRLEVFHVEQ